MVTRVMVKTTCRDRVIYLDKMVYRQRFWAVSLQVRWCFCTSISPFLKPCNRVFCLDHHQLWHMCDCLSIQLFALLKTFLNMKNGSKNTCLEEFCP